MVGNYSQVFSGDPVKPANISLLELVMAASTTLSWPSEVSASAVYFASIIDTTASVGGLVLTMPNALLAANGQSTIVTNIGANSFTVSTSTGVPIVVIAAGQQWLVYLYSNATASGLWRAAQLGATTSQAQAAALAGAGLVVDGTVLDVGFGTFLTNLTGQTLHKGNNANLFVWIGGVGTLALDTIANLGTNWCFPVTNQGTGALTITPSGGATINGAASFVLQPGNSAFILANTINQFFTFCNTQSPVSVINGGTGATSAAPALVNLGGTTIGISIFTAPNAAAVKALLGLTITTPMEVTVAVNQTLNAGSTQTAFVCTAALQLNLPLSTTLTNGYIFYAYAQGGAVTVHPNVADAINGGVAGANLTINLGQSAFFTTDANGNWWPFFLSTSGTVTSVAMTAPAELVVTGSPIVGAGTLALAWANENPNRVFAGPGTGGAGTPTFRTLVAADTDKADTQTTIASAATTNIGAAAVNYLQVTGVTPITAFDNVTAGIWRKLEFAGILTLTNNASIILPGAANITTAAGDIALMISEGGAVWRCLVYTKASGQAIKAASGSVAQVVNTQTGAVATGSTAIPFDDTIPQNTEGDQYMSLAITPTSATSKLKIEVVVNFSDSLGGREVVALFQDATANALACCMDNISTATGNTCLAFTHFMTAGTILATTFKVRIGSNSGGTITFNGIGGGRDYGGVLASSITITELLP